MVIWMNTRYVTLPIILADITEFGKIAPFIVKAKTSSKSSSVTSTIPVTVTIVKTPMLATQLRGSRKLLNYDVKLEFPP